MSLYQQQREQVKKSILDTSVLLFKQRGYEDTTIDEITKTIGIAKGTFYNFYKSKSEILMSWAGQKFQTLDIHEAFNANKTLADNLYKFIEIMVKAIEGEEELFQFFLKEILKVHDDKEYNKQFDFISIYRLIIKNSNDADRIAKSLLDTKIEVLNNSLFMGIINWFGVGNSVEGLQQHLINILQVCLYGILNDIGGD